MTWFTFSLISIFALALAELLQQKLLNDGNELDPRTSGVITFGIQTILALPVIFLFGLNTELFSVFQPHIFTYLILTSLTSAIAMNFYLKSFIVKNISFSSMLISFSVVISTILGILLFNESISGMKLLGIALILLALVSLNFRNEHLERNHLFGLLAGVFFGITYTFDKWVVLEIHPLIYLFWSFFFVVLIGFLQNPTAVSKTAMSVASKELKILFLSGFGYFIYNICTFFSYSYGGEVGRIDAINNSQVFLIILVEYFVFKHSSGMARKLVTAAVAVVGVFILGNF